MCDDEGMSDYLMIYTDGAICVDKKTHLVVKSGNLQKF